MDRLLFLLLACGSLLLASCGGGSSDEEIQTGRFLYHKIVESTDLRPDVNEPYGQFSEVEIDNGYIKFLSQTLTGHYGLFGARPNGELLSLANPIPAPIPNGPESCSGGFNHIMRNALEDERVWVIGSCIYPSFFATNLSIFSLADSTVVPVASPGHRLSSDLGPISQFNWVAADADLALAVGRVDSGVAIFQIDTETLMSATSLMNPGDPVPGSNLVFTNYSGIAVDENANIVFTGASEPTRTGTIGVYRLVNNEPVPVVDSTMQMPNTGQLFDILLYPQIDGTSVVFKGEYFTGLNAVDTFEGIYLRQGVGDLIKIADESTPFPDSEELFSFMTGASVESDSVIFTAYGDVHNLPSIFLFRNGETETLLGRGDILDGRTIAGATIWQGGRDGDSLAIKVTFEDGASAIYRILLLPN